MMRESLIFHKIFTRTYEITLFSYVSNAVLWLQQ